MRHITIKNRYEFDTDTNHGGSTELEKGEVLDGDVDKKCWLIAAHWPPVTSGDVQTAEVE